MAVYGSSNARKVGPVAITIRNKETEELIRRIGRRTGEEPDAVMLRLVKAEDTSRQASTVPPEEVAKRREFFEQLRKKYPPPEDQMTWAEVEEEMDSIFGDDLK